MPKKNFKVSFSLPSWSFALCTVCQIVPVITLFATLVHGGLTANWFFQWIRLAVICFPMALCAQVFYIGPFVRLIFRTLFKKQLAQH